MAGDQGAGGQPPQSRAVRWTSVGAAAVLFGLMVFGAVSYMPKQSPSAMVATATALAIAMAALGWHIVRRRWTLLRESEPRRLAPALVPLVTVGLCGIALDGLLPNATGYVVLFMALIALGFELPPGLALLIGTGLLAATNVVVTVIRPQYGTSVISNDVGAVFLFSVGLFTRSIRVAQAQAWAAQERAEDLVVQLRAAQAAETEHAALTERARVAREVHDILAHSLSGLVLTLDTAELIGRKEDDPRSQERILEQVTRAQRIARDGLADTRRAVAALRGDELPGPALLEHLVRDTSETAGIRATLTVTGSPCPLSPEAGLAVYRTAQEALINSAKYAGPGSRAELRLAYAAAGPDDCVELEIEDFRSPQRRAPRPGGLTFGGYGLTGIRERAELLGGELTASPTEEGFRVLLRLPAAPSPREVEAG